MNAPLTLDMCPTCDGKGEIRVIDDYGWDEIEECPTCGGSGSTVVEVEPDEVAVVTTICDRRPVAEQHAAWKRFREHVAAMGRKS